MKFWILALVNTFTLAKRFRVKYTDNKYSIPMSYYTARNYKNIFGGKVELCPKT